jgi:hypothetical protein
MHEACNTEKIIAANMNDIMIDRKQELWFEGKDFELSYRRKTCAGGPSNQDWDRRGKYSGT